MSRRPISPSGRIAIAFALAASALVASHPGKETVASGEVHPKDELAYDKKPSRSKRKKKFHDPHAYKKPPRHSR